MQEELQRKQHLMQDRMTEKFLTFGTISLIFGILFTACFYKAGLGLSYFIFTGITIVLLSKVSKELYHLREQKEQDEFEQQKPVEASRSRKEDENQQSSKKSLKNRYYAKFCYGAAFLISLSAMFTASEFLWLLDTVAILMLLEISLIVEITGEKEWAVGKYFGVMIHMLFLSIFGFMYPFMDGVEYAKTRKKKRSEKVIQILTGLCIAVPILFVVISLLASSDAVFSGITSSIMKGIFVSGDPLFILILAFVMTILCYAVIKAVCCLDDQLKEKDAWNSMRQGEKEVKSRSYTFITVVASLTAVYVIYVGIQIVMLFSGSKSMLPEGMTYAEYAREGFFELLVVTLINFIVVLCCVKAAKESKVLQILLLIFSACTFGMIFSAGYRIILYISVYHLTMLRLMVVWFLVLNCLLMTGAIISILREGFPLFRYCVGVVSICFIILSFGKPDAVIASYNMKHDTELSREEITYLAMLSADAAPYVMPLLEEKNLTGGERKSITFDFNDLGTWDLVSFGNRILSESEGRGIRGLNISYLRAKKAASKWNYQYIQKLD